MAKAKTTAKPKPKSKKKSRKGVGGQPTKYKPRYCQDILNFFDVDATIEKIKTITTAKGTIIEEPIQWAQTLPMFEGFAKKLGVCVDTLLEWKKVHPEFSASYIRAKENQKEIWATNGLLGRYNPAFAKYFGVNFLGMKDKTEHDIGVSENLAQVASTIFNQHRGIGGDKPSD